MMFIRTIWGLLCAFILLLSGIQHVSAQNTVVKYLPPESEDDSRSFYYFDLLELAMEKTIEDYGPYTLKPAEGSYTQREGLKAMRDDVIDVVHTMTSKPRELVFKPIRIPLTKGLIGYRLLLVLKGNEDIVSKGDHLSAIKDITYVQGSDWPDTEILEKNGFKIKSRKNYPDLFEMLKNNEGDAFPRSILEIWEELKAQPDFELEDDILIKYPAAVYFFTKLENIKLAERIETGLKLAIEDGSFDSLFNKYYGDWLDNAKISNRKIIELENPLLPKETPVDKHEYWLNVETL